MTLTQRVHPPLSDPGNVATADMRSARFNTRQRYNGAARSYSLTRSAISRVLRVVAPGLRPAPGRLPPCPFAISFDQLLIRFKSGTAKCLGIEFIVYHDTVQYQTGSMALSVKKRRWKSTPPRVCADRARHRDQTARRVQCSRRWRRTTSRLCHFALDPDGRSRRAEALIGEASFPSTFDLCHGGRMRHAAHSRTPASPEIDTTCVSAPAASPSRRSPETRRCITSSGIPSCPTLYGRSSPRSCMDIPAGATRSPPAAASSGCATKKGKTPTF